MDGTIILEEHFAIPATLGDSHAFGAHVWDTLGPRLTDFHDQRLRLMDEAGVAIMILSLNAPTIQRIRPGTCLSIVASASEQPRVAEHTTAEFVFTAAPPAAGREARAPRTHRAPGSGAGTGPSATATQFNRSGGPCPVPRRVRRRPPSRCPGRGPGQDSAARMRARR